MEHKVSLTTATVFTKPSSKLPNQGSRNKAGWVWRLLIFTEMDTG